MEMTFDIYGGGAMMKFEKVGWMTIWVNKKNQDKLKKPNKAGPIRVKKGRTELTTKKIQW